MSKSVTESEAESGAGSAAESEAESETESEAESEASGIPSDVQQVRNEEYRKLWHPAGDEEDVANALTLANLIKLRKVKPIQDSVRICSDPFHLKLKSEAPQTALGGEPDASLFRLMIQDCVKRLVVIPKQETTAAPVDAEATIAAPSSSKRSARQDKEDTQKILTNFKHLTNGRRTTETIDDIEFLTSGDEKAEKSWLRSPLKGQPPRYVFDLVRRAANLSAGRFRYQTEEDLEKDLRAILRMVSHRRWRERAMGPKCERSDSEDEIQKQSRATVVGKMKKVVNYALRNKHWLFQWRQVQFPCFVFLVGSICWMGLLMLSIIIVALFIIARPHFRPLAEERRSYNCDPELYKTPPAPKSGRL